MSRSESDAESSSSSASESEDEDVTMQSSEESGSESEAESSSASESESEAASSESEADESAAALEAEREAKRIRRREANLKKKAAKAAATPAAAPATPARPASAPSAPASAAAPSSSAVLRPSQLLNKLIKPLGIDYYYHLGLSSALPLKEMFGDVRFVILSGSAVRAAETAQKLQPALGVHVPTGCTISPIGKTERYSLYKVGPVLSVSHGMGKPSISIMLHELTKMLAAAGVLDKCTYIRVGTSGGVGVDPGTVIVSSGTVNGALEPTFPVIVLGKTVNRPCVIQPKLVEEVLATAKPAGANFNVIKGLTMATDDFYEGQGRLDGAIADYTMEDKMAFLKVAHNAGIKNIEMESDCIVAFCTRLHIPCAVVCCAIVNRLNGDQVLSTPAQLVEYADNAVQVTIRFIQARLKMAPKAGEKVHKKALKGEEKAAARAQADEKKIRMGGKAVPHVAGSGTDFMQSALQQPHTGAVKQHKKKHAAAAAAAAAASSGSATAPNSQKKHKKKQQQQQANGQAPASAKKAATAPSTPAPSSKKKKNKTPAATPVAPATPAVVAPPATPATPAAAAVAVTPATPTSSKALDKAVAAAAKAAAKALALQKKDEEKAAKAAEKAKAKAEKEAAKAPKAASASDKKKAPKAASEKKDKAAAAPSATALALATLAADVTPAAAAAAPVGANRREKKRLAEEAKAAAAAAAEQKVADEAAAIAKNRAEDLAKFNPYAAAFPKVKRPNKNERLAERQRLQELARNGVPPSAAAGTPAKPAANGAPATGEKRKMDADEEKPATNGAASEKKSKKPRKEKEAK